MDASIIPAAWKNFLSKIQTIHPDAIIAGGALRDIITDNMVKDVDIFIPDADVNVQDIADLFGIKVETKADAVVDHIKLTHDFKTDKKNALKKSCGKTGIIGKKYALETHINLLFDVQYNGVLYQLIFVECDPVQMVYQDFDFGICKVYYDGKELVLTDEFEYDLENKQLTLSGAFSDGQLLHTMHVHRPNLVKKFPNWNVVIDLIEKKKLESYPPSYRALLEKIGAEEVLGELNGYVYSSEEYSEMRRKQHEATVSTYEKKVAKMADEMEDFKYDLEDQYQQKIDDVLKMTFPDKRSKDYDGGYDYEMIEVTGMNGVTHMVKGKAKPRKMSYGEELIQALQQAETDLNLCYNGDRPHYNFALNEDELIQLIKQLRNEIDREIGFESSEFF